VNFLLQKEIRTAKKLNKKKKANYAYKSFEKIMEYCEQVK
jgi:hypothetical protein